MADDVSDNISRSVKTICSNKEDVTSALSFFEGYCDMTNGTSSFAKLDGPKGDSQSAYPIAGDGANSPSDLPHHGAGAVPVTR